MISGSSSWVSEVIYIRNAGSKIPQKVPNIFQMNAMKSIRPIILLDNCFIIRLLRNLNGYKKTPPALP